MGESGRHDDASTKMGSNGGEGELAGSRIYYFSIAIVTHLHAAYKLSMDTSEEKKKALNTAAASTSKVSLGRSDYDAIQDALESQVIPDYSSIEDIFNILPREATGGNLNVFIVASNGLNAAGEPKNTDRDSRDATTPKRKKIPAYSVVNKKRPRNPEDAEPEFTLQEEGMSHDIQANDIELAPPPPIPPRSYEMTKLESNTPDLSKVDAKKDIPRSEDGELVPTKVDENGATTLSLDFTAQEAASATNNPTFAPRGARRYSYESVDLGFPEPAGGKEAA